MAATKPDSRKKKSELLDEIRFLRNRVEWLEADQQNLLAGDQTLSERGEQLRIIFEHSNDAILLVDLEEDRILDSNPKASSLLGYTREELQAGKASMLHPNEVKKAQRFARRVSKTGEGWTNELRCTTKNGDLVSAEISASIVRYQDRTCVVSLIRDVSDRERLQEENEYLRRELSTEGRFGDIIGSSPALEKTIQQVRMVAGTEAAVLITGESGTGKELVARAIHTESNRAAIRRSYGSTARRFHTICSRVNSSGTSRAHLPEPSATASADSSLPTAELCSWMKWERYRLSSRASCYAWSRKESSSVWARASRAVPMSGS